MQHSTLHIQIPPEWAMWVSYDTVPMWLLQGVVNSYNNNNNTRHLDAPFTKVPWRLQRVQKVQTEQQNQNR